MGGEQLADSKPVTYTQIFYQHLPYYLAIGMPYELFWNGDCVLVEIYRKAYELKEKQNNQQSWLQGLYFYEALLDVSPVIHAFAKKGTTAIPYPSEPYALTKHDAWIKKEKTEQLKYSTGKAKVKIWADRINKKMN